VITYSATEEIPKGKARTTKHRDNSKHHASIHKVQTHSGPSSIDLADRDRKGEKCERGSSCRVHAASATSRHGNEKMISVDSLTKEWLDLALSKPKISHDLESRWQKQHASRPEEYKYACSPFGLSSFEGSTLSTKHGRRKLRHCKSNSKPCMPGGNLCDHVTGLSPMKSILFPHNA